MNFLTLLLRSLPVPISSLSLPPQRDAPHYRDFFYVGGQYTPIQNSTEHTHTSQLYVERLTPLHPNLSLPSVILLHGTAQTGTNFLNTPDSRPGWASFFLNAGYTVYIPDQLLQGRSPAPPQHPSLATLSAEQLERYFTNTKKHALWPQASLHDQWPGTGERGDKVFDAFYAANVPFDSDALPHQERMKNVLVKLIRERVEGEVVIAAHSQAGFWAWPVAEEVGPDRVRGVVALEPPGPPFEDKVVIWQPPPQRAYGLTDLPLQYDPPVQDTKRGLLDGTVRVGEETPERSSCLLQKPPAKQLKILKEIPALVVTGEASFHVVYEHCTVEFLRQAGVETKWLELGKRGVRGNGHMFFMERNNWDSWKPVEEWIREPKKRERKHEGL